MEARKQGPATAPRPRAWEQSSGGASGVTARTASPDPDPHHVDCPPGAIFDTKQMVRGSKKWYIDFDKCIPYVAKTDGCAICIQVCPWSVSGRGPSLSQQLLAKRRK